MTKDELIAYMDKIQRLKDFPSAQGLIVNCLIRYINDKEIKDKVLETTERIALLLLNPQL
jgi:hypothetical protein